MNSGKWTSLEHKKFVNSVLNYGNNWKKVSKCI